MQENILSKNRILYIYELLTEGKAVNKKQLALQFNVSERSIQRDLDDLRLYFAEQGAVNDIIREIIYDRAGKGYKLVPPLRTLLSSEEVFAVLKILLESRAFVKSELNPILTKLIECCVPVENKLQVQNLISNEKFHYLEPKHGKSILATMWALSEAITAHQEVKLTYTRMNGSVVQRTVQPVGIMFSEFYFYLLCFIKTEERKQLHYEAGMEAFPTVYRIDRVNQYEVLAQKFSVPYSDRFEEGEFRKRVQFMYSGKLQKVKFYFRGPSLEAVLDRLPTAKVLKQEEKGYLVVAEAYGNGIYMWLRSQGDNVEIVE